MADNACASSDVDSLIPMPLRRDVYVVFDTPGLRRIFHSYLLALIHEDGPALSNGHDCQHLRGQRAIRFLVISESRHRTSVVVVLNEDRVPSAQ